MKSIREICLDDLDELTEILRENSLTNKTILYIHATLRKALNYALKRGYVDSNVYDRYDLPRAESYSYIILTDSQYAQMISYADGRTPLSLAIRLALRYGLRRGEILGIVPNVDLMDRVLHIQRSRSVENGQEVVTPCKTKNSDRYILLLEEDTVALRARHTGYAVPISPTQLNRGFSKFLEHGGFPHMRFHDLRHNYATFMYRHHIDVKTISTVLGHSSVKVTLDIYAHPDLQVQSACLEVLP